MTRFHFFDIWKEHAVHPERLLGWSNDASRPTPLDAERLDDLICAEAPLRPVLYWMTASRRLRSNAALAAATLAAHVSRRPLLVVESLAAHYPWASERHHAFFLGGIEERVAAAPGYLFVPTGSGPRTRGDPAAPADALEGSPRGFELGFFHGIPQGEILPRLLTDAALVVTDWQPHFIFPSLVAHLAHFLRRRGIPLLLVDDCGVVPLAAHAKPEHAARFLRPKLTAWIDASPSEEAGLQRLLALPIGHLQGALNLAGEHLHGSALACSRPFSKETLLRFADVTRAVPALAPGASEGEAQRCWRAFLENRISGYGEDKSHPDRAGTSGLSPHLHAGALHPRAMVTDVFTSQKVTSLVHIRREDGAGAFLDELLTWRELGLNMSHFAFAAGIPLGSARLVPEWARKTLEANLPLSPSLDLATLEEARTPDPIWNATQRELVTTGRVHGYLRMLWGKGIVRWSRNVQEALSRMEHLNNKYALDGRDANSWLGFLWCLGKYDRPWPPARPPFGLVRSMSTQNARRKVEMEQYLRRFG